MTKKQSIDYLKDLWNEVYNEDSDGYTYAEAIDIAIEALQFAEHFDLLKEFQSLQEVVRCNDCLHQEHCYKTVAHNKRYDGFNKYWSETIEWCSRGERREESEVEE